MDGPKFTFEKIKVYLAWGGKRHDGPPYVGLGGMAGMPPSIRQCVPVNV